MTIITGENKLNIQQAVEYAVAMIHKNPTVVCKNFFLHTQFGTIPVETKLSRKMRVNVCKFDNAPGTAFVLANRGTSLAWYLGVSYNPLQKEAVTRALVVSGLLQIMLAEVSQTPVTRNDAELIAACFMYYRSYVDENEIYRVICEYSKMKAGTVVYTKDVRNYEELISKEVFRLKHESEDLVERFDMRWGKLISRTVEEFHRNFALIATELFMNYNFNGNSPAQIGEAYHVLKKFGIEPKEGEKSPSKKAGKGGA